MSCIRNEDAKWQKPLSAYTCGEQGKTFRAVQVPRSQPYAYICNRAQTRVKRHTVPPQRKHRIVSWSPATRHRTWHMGDVQPVVPRRKLCMFISRMRRTVAEEPFDSTDWRSSLARRHDAHTICKPLTNDEHFIFNVSENKTSVRFKNNPWQKST